MRREFQVSGVPLRKEFQRVVHKVECYLNGASAGSAENARRKLAEELRRLASNLEVVNAKSDPFIR